MADNNKTVAINQQLKTNKVEYLSHAVTDSESKAKFSLISVSGGKKAVAELRRALAQKDIRIPEKAVNRTPTTAAQKNRTDLTFTVALSKTNVVNKALDSNKGSIGYKKLELITETTSFFDIMDKYFGTLCLVIISLSLSLYVGWMLDSKKIVGEIEKGCPSFTKPLIAGKSPAAIWIFFIRFVCPVVIFVVLLGKFGVEIF